MQCYCVQCYGRYMCIDHLFLRDHEWDRTPAVYLQWTAALRWLHPKVTTWYPWASKETPFLLTWAPRLPAGWALASLWTRAWWDRWTVHAYGSVFASGGTELTSILYRSIQIPSLELMTLVLEEYWCMMGQSTWMHKLAIYTWHYASAVRCKFSAHCTSHILQDSGVLCIRASLNFWMNVLT